jgi:hypothetical protein
MLFMAACFLFAQGSILTFAPAIFCAAPHGSGDDGNEFVRIRATPNRTLGAAPAC